MTAQDVSHLLDRLRHHVRGVPAWQASRVDKYRLRVSIPGRSPHETDCAICAAGIREGSTVGVAVSRHNHRRVTIDVGQGGDHAPRDTGVTTYTLPAGGMGTRPAYEGLSAGGYEAAGSWAGPQANDPIGHQKAENDAFERAEPAPGKDHRYHRG